MITNPYYHGITRKLIVAVGNLLSGIKIERKNSSNIVEQIIDVPISYGNKEKWLQKLTEDPNLDKRVMITLPRIGFEMVGMEYDPSRKLNKITQFRSCQIGSNGNVPFSYAPVPYNINFMVYVMTKTQDDALQIVEQILPFFSPQYIITVNLIPDLGIVQDIPFNLNSVDINDTFEGPMETRREIVYTLSFTAKTEFMGPINKDDAKVILHTKVRIDPETGEIARQVDTDVVGTIEDYQIVDDFFDILRPTIPDWSKP